jgi:PhzF family phenazine biosynthesis protein
MGLKILQVDAFTAKPFGGNPAAVCVSAAPLAEGVMQAIAAEMNLSETAFLHPLKDSPEDGYSLRWFTPLMEVDLCGHATLASAHVLWQEGHLPPAATARFFTRSGWLSAVQKIDGQSDWIEMDFPAQPVSPTEAIPELIGALMGEKGDRSNVLAVAKDEVNYLVELDSEKAVREMHPDLIALKHIPVQGVIVTAVDAGEPYDFVSRYFAPAVGIDEDPVTGSAHASLGPYWQAKLGKSAMLAQQVSLRGGVLKVCCTEANRVRISGQAVTVLRGELADL